MAATHEMTSFSLFYRDMRKVDRLDREEETRLARLWRDKGIVKPPADWWWPTFMAWLPLHANTGTSACRKWIWSRRNPGADACGKAF